jgi:DNA invertase Pin-like site-specific DNA recombinase
MAKGVSVHILNFGLVENTPVGRLILTNFLAYAEFERGMIIERTTAGKKQIKKTDPNYKEGRKSIKPENFSEFKKAVDDGAMSIRDAISAMGISRSSWYKYCRE